LAIVLSLLFGALLGWAYSVLARTDPNERIVVDLLVGALGAVAVALALRQQLLLRQLAGWPLI
jgi:uncharacterized membrane protein YeaQ/YmgE (transglycosylase-associated protein family)